MSDTCREREELIEMFGLHFESVHHLPPLGSRIYATLILDSCVRKTSFEDIIELTGASKSLVSTNLNLLLKLGKITYFNLPGDRKKYYRPSAFSERFDNYLRMISFEKKIMERMLCYRRKTVKCEESGFELEKTKAYNTHILQMEALIINTIDKFKLLEKEKSHLQQS